MTAELGRIALYHTNEAERCGWQSLEPSEGKPKGTVSDVTGQVIRFTGQTAASCLSFASQPITLDGR